MKKWNTLFDSVQEPLIALAIAIIFRGISSLILSINLARIYTFPSLVYLIAELLRYFGDFLIINFPLLVMIRALSKRYEGSFPAFAGFVAYIFFHVVTMYTTVTTMPNIVYSNILGISGDLNRLPIQTGVIAAVVVWAITRFSYRHSRNRLGYGLLSFIDKDSYCLILSVIGSGIAAFGIAFIWPYFIGGLYSIFRFIAYDITNPFNLFIYGVLEKILTLFNSSALIRESFWFGELGGSWLNVNGTNFIGDVSIWTAQATQGIFNTGAGRFITPHYVINIFAIPAIVGGVYSMVTDKLERRKYTIFLVAMIALSIVIDTTLPIEIFLFVMCPLAYFGHVFIVGGLFALFQGIGVHIGYSYNGKVSSGTPGSIFDLLFNMRNTDIQGDILIVLLVGVVIAVLYVFAIRYYYKYLAIDIMQTGKTKRIADSFIDSVGGTKNIKMLNSTPTKVIVQIENKTLIDFNKLQRNGAYKIVESRAGYSIYFGSSSTMIKKEVSKQM